MKYSQYSRERKGNSAFYIILAICLLVVGIVAWFAFSNLNNNNTDMNPNARNNASQNNSEYNSNTPSYNESENQNSIDERVEDGIDNGINQVIPTEPTAEEVENEPYTKAYTMPVNGDVLKDFNATALQYSATYGDMRIHNGVDITCKEGTVVSACTDGTVQSVEQTSTFGGVVTIDHGDGLVIKYASLKDITVKNGDVVASGDIIGAVSTVPCECEDQSHIHLEAYKNGAGISILSLFE